MGYPNVSLQFLCDPHEPSLEKSIRVLQEFHVDGQPLNLPDLCRSEDELFQRANEIDLLVIATPNHLHTDTIIRWGTKDISILCEKPAAVSLEQHSRLTHFMQSADFCARVWVAMEYRYIPAIAKLLTLLPTVGDIKMVTIRENRVSWFCQICSTVP
jgi:predicted dehydrogenase